MTLQGQWHSEQRVKKDVRPYFPVGGWLQWVVGRWVSRFSTGSWVSQLAGKAQAVSWTSVRWNPGKCRCKWIMIQRCRKLETKSMRLNKETLGSNKTRRPIYCCCLADDLAKSGVWTGLRATLIAERDPGLCTGAGPELHAKDESMHQSNTDTPDHWQLNGPYQTVCFRLFYREMQM